DAWLHGVDCGPDYWTRNLRNPVHFRQAITALAAEGPTVFVELSPHPILQRPIEQTLSAIGAPGWALPSCRRDEDERSCMLATAAELFRRGIDVDVRAVFAGNADERAKRPVAVLVSAKSEAGVEEQAKRLREHVQAHPEQELEDIAYTLATKRTHFE